MPERCTKCGQFSQLAANHTCRKPGPRPSGNAKWRSDSPEAKAYRNGYQERWRNKHPGYREKFYTRDKAARDRLRTATLIAYGGDPPTCACCGERHVAFLTLDHVNGGGSKDRRANNHKGGTAQYAILRRAGWPPGFRVLCWNCNAALGLWGQCPHQDR